MLFLNRIVNPEWIIISQKTTNVYFTIPAFVSLNVTDSGGWVSSADFGLFLPCVKFFSFVFILLCAMSGKVFSVAFLIAVRQVFGDVNRWYKQMTDF